MNRRPIAFITFAYMIGIIVQQYLNLQIDLIILYFFISIVCTTILFLYQRKYVVGMLLIAFILLGGLNTEISNKIGKNLEGFTDRNVEIIGRAYRENISENKDYILIADSLIIDNKIYDIDEKIIMKLYYNQSDKNTIDNKTIKVEGKLEKPTEARNPKMFDYQLYLKSKKIHYILYTNRSNIEVIKSKNDKITLLGLRNNIKEYIYEKTLKMLPNNGPVLLSISFGDKDILDEELYENFRLSGIAHILAVSGLHFGLLSIFLNAILLKLRLKETKRIVILLSIIWMFTILVGFTPSAIRASIMVTLFTLSNILDRKYDLFTSLSTVAFIVLLINPFLIFSIGFQLSFGAVLSIGLFYNPIHKRLVRLLPESINKLFSVTLSAQLGTVPLTAYYFNILSPWALFINIIMVLLVGYIVPMIFIFLIFLFIHESISIIIAPVLNILIKLLIHIAKFNSFLPFNNINVISPSLLFLIFYYSIIILSLNENRKSLNINKKRIILILFSIYLSIYLISVFYPRDLKITFVDVGQGDCILIQTPRGQNILIDGGKSIKEDFLKEFLLKNRIGKIDLAVISHIHDDHIGGIINLLGEVNIGLILMPKTPFSSEESILLNEKTYKEGVEIIYIDRNHTIRVEQDLVLKAINPSKDILRSTGNDENNNSLVILLDYKNFESLFTGDIEKETENDIITKVHDIDIDVLKVAHHGSDTSTTQGFLDSFTPETAVIQVGKNTYGHPNKTVLSRLRKNNIEVYRNDINGAVILKTDGNDYKVYRILNN